MGSKSSKAPDYRGAAEQQGADSRFNTEYQTNANRIDQYTPWGSSTFSSQVGPDGMPSWQQYTNLNPMDQQILDQDRGISLGRSGIAGQLMPGLYEQMMSQSQGSENAPDWAGTPALPTYDPGSLPGMGNTNLDTNASPSPEQILAAVGGMSGYQPADLLGLPQFQQGNQQGTGAYQQFQPGGRTQIQGGLNDAEYDPQFAQANYDRQMSLMGDERKQAAVQMEASLRNQGLTPGSEAYDNQMKTFRNQQGEELDRLSNASVLRGADEQNRQFGRNLAEGNFFNQASNQAFGQGMGIADQMARQRSQQFGENQQMFGQGMGLADQLSQQRGQAFGERMGLSDQASGMRGQQMGEIQALQQMLSGQDQAQWDRQMQQGQWQDRQRQQALAERMGLGELGFDQSMQGANFQNTLRQGYRTEQQQDQGWNLNMINALLAGGQIGMPSMPGFNTADRADTTQYLDAANYLGQNRQANAANATAAFGSMMDFAGGAMPTGGFGG